MRSPTGSARPSYCRSCGAIVPVAASACARCGRSTISAPPDAPTRRGWARPARVAAAGLRATGSLAATLGLVWLGAVFVLPELLHQARPKLELTAPIAVAASAVAAPSATPLPTPTRVPTATPVPTAAPFPRPTPAAQPVTAPTGWLDRLNYYRALAGVPPVVESQTLDDGAAAHAAYQVLAGELSHDEDAGAPGYSNSGQSAAQHGNTFGASTAATTDAEAIDQWIATPFHALGLLDPRLDRVGYGAHRDAHAPKMRMSAVLDVGHGLADRARVDFPVLFPGPGARVPLNETPAGEWPDPFASCGYSAPAGLPIVVLARASGAAREPVVATEHSVTIGGEAVAHCVLDAATYHNASPADQQWAREGLAGSGALVLLPRAPLTVGATYQVAVTISGRRIGWSFTVTAAGPA